MMHGSLFELNENLLPFDGEVLYYSGFFTPGESDMYLQLLENEIIWKQEPVKIFGKEVLQPRLTALYGDQDKPYTYSGVTMRPHKWTMPLLEIKRKIEEKAGVHFSSVLLNFYRGGKDSMGWHRDNEKELGINPVIGSVSFGATRTFILRNCGNRKIKRSVELTHGSFLLMKGSTQHFWEHHVPKTEKTISPRINLTFRIIM
jgi:alkylated DNA repair dioxygenase AlkB